MTNLRVGFGQDRHRLENDNTLIIGGVTIDSTLGTIGHSDGDVAVHALIDALIGAAGWGDIGEFFPDDDPQWKDAASIDLLQTVSDHLRSESYRVINLDITIQMEAIKLSHYRSEMTANILHPLPGNPQANVKFTTGEAVGPVGRNECVDASCIVLLQK